MGIQVEKTALDGLSIEVKQDDRYIYVRPIVTNIHDLVENLLIEEGKQLTMYSITTINRINKIKNGEISEKEGYKKLSKSIITLKNAIKRRKRIKNIVKFLIHLDKNLLRKINKLQNEIRIKETK